MALFKMPRGLADRKNLSVFFEVKIMSIESSRQPCFEVFDFFSPASL
jgi:hypothetical protein